MSSKRHLWKQESGSHTISREVTSELFARPTSSVVIVVGLIFTNIAPCSSSSPNFWIIQLASMASLFTVVATALVGSLLPVGAGNIQEEN